MDLESGKYTDSTENIIHKASINTDNTTKAENETMKKSSIVVVNEKSDSTIYAYSADYVNKAINSVKSELSLDEMKEVVSDLRTNIDSLKTFIGNYVGLGNITASHTDYNDGRVVFSLKLEGNLKIPTVSQVVDETTGNIKVIMSI